MALMLFNTLGRKKEKFAPAQGKKVKMYSCGPTVYDYAHIGNFRAYIVSDLLRRYLEYSGYDVKLVMNLTDVDDKTIKGSRKQGISLDKYTEKYKKAFFEDIDTLNIKRASVYPEATKYIDEMVALVKKLMEKGFAYKSDDGSVYFDIKKFGDYGKLSGLDLKELRAGARVSQDEYEKEQAQDFALWKGWDKEDGDVFWVTEIGKGRPGWHIECSAMSAKNLGEGFDIHTGGVDLIFPHHENEIAQSMGATGKRFVRYWVHNEHLLVEGRKMSKSLGNFHTLRDLLEKGHTPKAIRYLLLSTHYRQKLNFTMKGLEAAGKTVERIQNFMNMLDSANGKNTNKAEALIEKARKNFESAMDDDLSISEALASLFDFMKDINKMSEEGSLGRKDAEKVMKAMKDFDNVLGILEDAGKVKVEKSLEKTVEKLVSEREEARKNKDFAKADEIRDKLAGMGIVLEDTKNGVRWKLKN